MTRCYEFYEVFRREPSLLSCSTNPKFRSQVKKYIGFLESKGVTWDKSPEDLGKFETAQKEKPERELYRKPKPNPVMTGKPTSPIHEKTKKPTKREREKTTNRQIMNLIVSAQ